jgi:hypothetical protein
MKAKQPLSEQFAQAQADLDEAQRAFERVRGEYFFDRRRRAQAGEELEPLNCTDSSVWQDQLAREQIARANGEQDRLAGLVA